jgi:hypothetical protein
MWFSSTSKAVKTPSDRCCVKNNNNNNKIKCLGGHMTFLEAM